MKLFHGFSGKKGVRRGRGGRWAQSNAITAARGGREAQVTTFDHGLTAAVLHQQFGLPRLGALIHFVGVAHALQATPALFQYAGVPGATKGGVAGGWAFFDLLNKGIAPKALVFGKLNPVMVQGAVLARMPVTEGWDQNLLDLVRTGDRVRIDPQSKTITVLR